tara:strand:- start:1444 stop:2289 length:846 start_codon:yes stop_codon:yes gene_type:complete
MIDPQVSISDVLLTSTTNQFFKTLKIISGSSLKFEKKMKRKIEKNFENVVLVYWDLETTSRSRPRIIQIGWTSCMSEGELLILPKIPIEMNAGKVHGYDMNKLINLGAKDTFTQLNTFMRSIENIKKPVIMLAHNGKSFDTNVLRHELETENVNIANNILGFVDTLHWMRHACKIKNAKLDDLIVDYLHENVRLEHGALEDSRLLKRVVEYILNNTNEELSYFESMDDFLVRTEKWSNEQEKLKDFVEEIETMVEQNCEHWLKTNEDIQLCVKCSYWRFIK